MALRTVRTAVAGVFSTAAVFALALPAGIHVIPAAHSTLAWAGGLRPDATAIEYGLMAPHQLDPTAVEY